MGGEAARTNAEEGSTKPVPSPSGVQKVIYPASAQREFAGGWTDGRTEDQIGPSIFFILYWYIVQVYMYLKACSKFVINIVMGFKN